MVEQQYVQILASTSLNDIGFNDNFNNSNESIWCM